MTRPQHGKAFQLLLYAYLYYKDQKTDPARLETGNVSLKMPGKGFLKVQLPDNEPMNASSMEVFEEHLEDLLEKIFDPDAVFDQTEDENNCKFCPFKGICGR